MKKCIYSIRDEKMGSFGVPVIIENDAVAVRQFGDVIAKGGDNVMCLHPEDFAIYCLAEYDMEHGLFINLEHPRKLACGSDFAKE